MSKHVLSKSSYIRGLQCHKSLYLYKKRYFLKDPVPPEQQARFKRGIDVGMLARQLFPGGIDLSPKTPFQYPQSVKKTAEEIEAGTEIIYEAAFQASQVLVALDILIKEGNAWVGYEVKSSLSISHTYLEDAALQYWVIKNSGLDIKDIRIIYIQKDYIRGDALDLKRLFTIESVLDFALSRYSFVEEEIRNQIDVTFLAHAPTIPVGSHCFIPYTCDFQGHCWKAFPKNNILQLTDIPIKDRYELLDAGRKHPDEVPASFPSTTTQRIQIESHSHQQDYLNEEALRKFLSTSGQNPVFLSFLSMAPAVPMVHGTKPYQTLPYSLAISGCIHEHPEIILIDKIAEDGWEDLTNMLLQRALKNEHIIVFDKLSQVKAIEYLAMRLPHHQEALTKIPALMLDLNEVFLEKYYYPAALQGDYSLAHIYKVMHNTPAGEKFALPSEAVIAMLYQQFLVADGGHDDTRYNQIMSYQAERLTALAAIYKHILDLLPSV